MHVYQSSEHLHIKVDLYNTDGTVYTSHSHYLYALYNEHAKKTTHTVSFSLLHINMSHSMYHATCIYCMFLKCM